MYHASLGDGAVWYRSVLRKIQITSLKTSTLRDASFSTGP